MNLISVALPDIGEGVTEGEMVKWLVQPGDRVEMDQPVAEVMTDKATVEVPCVEAGIVKELKVEEGDIVPIGTVMLTMEAAAAVAAPAKQVKKPAEAVTQAPAKQTVQQSAQPNNPSNATANFLPPAGKDVMASPHTRRFAREMQVDINHVSGTGPAGRITKDDIVSSGSAAGVNSGSIVMPTSSAVASVQAPAYSAPTKSIPGNTVGGPTLPDERVPLRGIRRKIAEKMQKAKHIVPHFTLMDEAIVTDLVKIRTQAKKAAEPYGVKVTYLPFIMKALIGTLREYPMLNASIDDEAQEIVYKKSFHLGFAADTPNGLMVPVIHNADQKSILQLSKEIVDLSTRAQQGKLKPEEMKGATITITNIGSLGGTYATPIINHPEVAILGMYKMTKKPVFVDGEFVPESVMNFTITADHRLIDGAVAARFLSSMFSRIENPSALMLEMV